MTNQELREKKPEELQALEGLLRHELGEFQLKVRMGIENHTARISQLRQEIARVLTIKREKEKPAPKGR